MNLESNPILIFPHGARTFWVFDRPAKVWTVHSNDAERSVLREAERWTRDRGMYLVGGMAYPSGDSGGAQRWGAFGAPVLLTLTQLRRLAAPYSPIVGPLRSKTTRDDYERSFAEVKAELREGNSYQINLTFRLEGTIACVDDPVASYLALWLDLYEQGQGDYGAFVVWDDEILLSLSPELFFRCEGDVVTCRPMKGTAARGDDPASDLELRRSLESSEKTRAENLMITDMIRNDLGKIARAGSVTVPHLFSIEAYPTLWQMTSTVVAKLPASIPDPLSTLIEALFPCASITGAPKRRSCQIIDRVEETPRGWYTGTIGWCRPGAVHDWQARFNVAIRTLEVKPDRTFVLGVGGGIVWDSEAEDEWREAWNKAKFLETAQRSFALTEALLWRPNAGYDLAREHEERLSRACTAFAGELDVVRYREALERAAIEAAKTNRETKVRIEVDPTFALTASWEPVTELPEVLTVALALRPHDESTLVYRQFKTTARSIYDREKRPGIDQVLHYNERGELTESTSMNLVLEIDGRMVTPALSCGLLDGTFRRRLLESGQAIEGVLTISDLRRATRIFLVNSVRGWKLCRLTAPETRRPTA